MDELDLIELTPNVDLWDPHATIYGEHEYSMINYWGEVKVPKDRNSPRRFIDASMISNTTDPTAFDKAISDLSAAKLSQRQQVSSIQHVDSVYEVCDTGKVFSTQKIDSLYSHQIDDTKTNAKAIARQWNVPLETSRKVIQSTTWLCKRNASDISLNCRYSNNGRMLRYPRVRAITFMDTLDTSKRCVHSVALPVLRYLPQNLVIFLHLQ